MITHSSLMDASSISPRKIKVFSWGSIINCFLICSRSRFAMPPFRNIKSLRTLLNYKTIPWRVKKSLCLCQEWEEWKRKKGLQFKLKSGVSLQVRWEVFLVFLEKTAIRLRVNPSFKLKSLHREFKLSL